MIRRQRAVLYDLERTKQCYLAEDLEVYSDRIVDASERISDPLTLFATVVGINLDFLFATGWPPTGPYSPGWQ